MPEVNLLPEEERKQVAILKVRKKLVSFSIATLIVTTIISILVFGYWASLVRSEKQLSTKINSLSSQIQSLSNVETLLRVLKNKLSALVGISAKSKNFETLLTDISQVIPQGVSLSTLAVSDKEVITLNGEAVSASEFSTLVTTLLREDSARTNFSNVTVESLSRDEDGIYKFAITTKIKND